MDSLLCASFRPNLFQLFYIAAMDLTYGAILCTMCGDYVYDPEIEELFRQQQRKSARVLGGMGFICIIIMLHDVSVHHRHAEPFQPMGAK